MWDGQRRGKEENGVLTFFFWKHCRPYLKHETKEETTLALEKWIKPIIIPIKTTTKGFIFQAWGR